MSIENILSRSADNERLTPNDAVTLLESNELAAIAYAADAVTRRKHPENFRTYNVERNINYTNICTSHCAFCAFAKTATDSAGYVLSQEQLFDKIAETLKLGGDQVLLQGGLHPDLPFEWYENLVRSIRTNFPSVNVHGFSPTEITFFSHKFNLSIVEVLLRLREAGLGSLPGGGAEILVDRVRSQVSPHKATASEWLEVCKEWHKLGGRGSATMMFGHVETIAERVEHLNRLRELQDETGGFTAFISWTFQPQNTKLSHITKLGSWEYLKTLAVSRLFLDNFDNIQASWVTQGMDIGTLSLLYGANDMGSVMIEENVVAAAGTVHRTTEQKIRDAIESAGFKPQRRDVFYSIPGAAQP
jgi:cyclic dehypoxanthinyl futalosine synthase